MRVAQHPTCYSLKAPVDPERNLPGLRINMTPLMICESSSNKYLAVMQPEIHVARKRCKSQIQSQQQRTWQLGENYSQQSVSLALFETTLQTHLTAMNALAILRSRYPL